MVERGDVRDFGRLRGFVASVGAAYGRIDYLVNNVGIDNFKSFAEMSMEEWKDSQDVILNAPVYLCKEALPFMRRQHFGRIINMGASSKDYMKGAAPGLAAFGVHKGALNIFTKTLALEEIGEGITVNMVAPWEHERRGRATGGRAHPVEPDSDRPPRGNR